MRAVLVSALAVGALLVTRAADAHVQNSASTQLGVVGRGDDSGLWQHTNANLGLRFESVWFRESPRDFGIGPYVEARTAWFHYGDYGGGLVALLPVDPTFPIWLGGGAFARRENDTWAPGYHGFVAWGSRSFNYESSYAMAYGLLLDARVHRGDLPGVDLVISASIDLEAFSFPLLYTISALRH